MLVSSWCTTQLNLVSSSVQAMDNDLSAGARRLLEISLRSQRNAAIAISEGGAPARSAPLYPHIIESITFSRQFLPTYLLLLCGGIVIWSLARWLNSRQKRWRQPTCASSVFSPSVASSSSSTLQGTESPSWKTARVSETVPLLSEAQTEGWAVRSRPRRAWHLIRSTLLRQPKPIPSITASRNTLPPNETSIVILLFLALNLFYLFYRMPLSKEYIFPMADRAGLVFVVNLPVLYILAAKNNQPLGWITGWSYEGLNLFHRRLGEWLTVAAVIHSVGMVIGFYQLLAPFGYSLGWYLTRPIIIFGVIAIFSYVVLYFTSLGSFRQAWYELFLVLHIFFQVIALAMLYFHHYDTRPYVGAAIAIWVLDRGVSRIACKTSSLVATLEVAEDQGTLLVYCDVPIRRSWSARFGIKSGWHAGQHVFLTVPGMRFKYRFQAHPFTIPTPAPPKDLSEGHWPLQLTIRAQDGFSRDLLEYAKRHQHTKVYIDGPYSSDEVLRSVTQSDRVCLIAGGSGIAVTYPFAWSRETSSVSSEEIIHDRARYVNGRKMTKSNVVKSCDSIDPYRFTHFWIRQDARHERWVTMLPNMARTSVSHSEPKCAVDLITHRFDTRSDRGGERPDIRAELEAWVRGDVKQKVNMHHSICVVVSGPDGLVRDVQNAVASLVRDGWNMDIHVEKFGW